MGFLGTPSLVSNESLYKVANKVNSSVRPQAKCKEFTLEIDPGTFDVNDLDFYTNQLGINRVLY